MTVLTTTPLDIGRSIKGFLLGRNFFGIPLRCLASTGSYFGQNGEGSLKFIADSANGLVTFI